MATMTETVARSPRAHRLAAVSSPTRSDDIGPTLTTPDLPCPRLQPGSLTAIASNVGRTSSHGDGGASPSRKRPCFATRSKFFKDPNNVPGFRSAASLQVADQPQAIEKDIRKAQKPARAKRKSSSVEVIEDGPVPAEDTNGDSATWKAKVGRQTAKKKQKEGVQACIAAAKVVKSAAASDISKDSRLKKPKKTEIQLIDEPATISENLTNCATIRRRRSWTPVDDSPCIVDDNATSPRNDTFQQHSSPTRGTSLAVFSTLKESFQYKGVTEQIPALDCPGPAPTRRRKVELVKSTSTGKDISTSVKVKAPKKKPRTITDKATEQFRPIEEQQSIAEAQRGAANCSRRKSRKKLKGDVDDAVTRVLPPQEAMDLWRQQDLVFGTPSQVLREDSPDTIRDIQKALQTSASETSASRSSWIELEPDTAGCLTPLSMASTSSRRLWTAAARNTDGSLLEAEHVDLTCFQATAGGVGLSATPVLMQAATSVQRALSPEPIRSCLMESAVNADDKGLRSTGTSDGKLAAKIIAEEGIVLPLQPDTTDVIADDQLQLEIGGMPNYDSWSDIQLKAAIEGFGFKPMKSRKPMIKKLEKCWNAQHPQQAMSSRSVLDVPTANSQDLLATSTSSRSIVVPVAKGAKARADATGRGSKGLPDRPASPVRASGVYLATAGVDAKEHGEEGSREFLFTKIQEAIKSCPPTHDATNLSWYEKILLYDPIVLEDLTIWLNSEGFGRVGVDDEVAPSLVRDWCESQSICCLWRLNMRGMERNRY